MGAAGGECTRDSFVEPDMRIRTSILGTCFAFVAGCSANSTGTPPFDGGDPGDSISGDVGGDGGDVGGGACGPKTATLKGTLGTTAIDQSYSSNGYALITKTFSGTIGTRGNVTITLVTAGASTTGTAIASAKLTMPNEGPSPGTVVCATGGVLKSGPVYTFTLTGLQLSDGADAGAGGCTGTPTAGEIEGCIGPGK